MPGHPRRHGSRLCYNKKFIRFFQFEQRYACCDFTHSDIWFLHATLGTKTGFSSRLCALALT